MQICSYCQQPFTPSHGNQRYCPICQRDPKRARQYMREYQRQRRGGRKHSYHLHCFKGRLFFTLPLVYFRRIKTVEGPWHVSVERCEDKIVAVIARQGTTPLTMTGTQCRIYIPPALCERLGLLQTYQLWGVTFAHAVDGAVFTATVTQKQGEQGENV